MVVRRPVASEHAGRTMTVSLDSNDSHHTAFLNDYYGKQRHFYDFSRRFFLFGRERLLRTLSPAQGSKVLEVGCGTARNLLRLGQRYPDAFYCGVDASRKMLEIAQHRVARHPNLEIRLAECAAEAMTDPADLGSPGGFDAIFFSYSLSMIPDWRRALEASLRCLAPGGTVHIVDFWDFGGWPRALARRLTRRLLNHHVQFDPEMHEWARKAAADRGRLELASVARRWAWIAHLTPETAHSGSQLR